MRKRRLLWCLSLFAALCLAPAAHAAEKSAGQLLQQYGKLAPAERKRVIEAGARKEGAVSFYGTMAVPDAKVLVDKFQQQYPYVRVQHVRLGASPMVSRVMTEHRGGRRDVDVVGITGPGAQVLIDSGLIDPYFTAERAAIRPGFISPKGLWTAVELYLISAGYNTRFVAATDAPRTYRDLLDKKWANS